VRWINKVFSAPLSVVLLIVIQLFCTFFFVSDVFTDYEELGNIAGDRFYLVMEAVASLSLLAACIFEFRYLVWLSRKKKKLEQRLDIAKRAVHEVMEHHFTEWQLTGSEREVCMLLVKGFPIPEIASLRGSAEGTIKAHLNNIYRKSGTRNQAELLSVLIDALVGDFEPARKQRKPGAMEAIAE